MLYVLGDTLFHFVCLIFYDFFYLTTFDFIMFSSIFKKIEENWKIKFISPWRKRNRYNACLFNDGEERTDGTFLLLELGKFLLLNLIVRAKLLLQRGNRDSKSNFDMIFIWICENSLELFPSIPLDISPSAGSDLTIITFHPHSVSIQVYSLAVTKNEQFYVR
jgi:hypothetical protein